MLNFLPGLTRDCEGFSRRNFLRIGTLAGLGMSLPQALAARAAQNGSGPDVNCILVWARGGASHHDTFDPKPNAPVSVRGEYSVINTAVPGVQFTEILPNMAREVNRFGVLRGWNPRNGSHGMADLIVMSGHRFNPAIPQPTMGSVVSHTLGFRSALPPFMQLGDQVDKRFGGGLPGFLGIEHGAFEVNADPSAENFVVRDITPPAGVTSNRLERRQYMLGEIDRMQRQADLQPAAYAALDQHTQAAFNMITAPETKRAFEIHREDPRLRDRYGRNRLGQSCLLARRMIESGVRFVTVTDGGWDTHANNFSSLKDRLVPRVDQALPTLLADLQDRGLLDTTLVCFLTDFGRTPQINSASGRDHWSTSGFAIMAGAGVPGGSILGRTDEEGGRVVDDEYFSEDIVTTVFAKIGVPLDLTLQTPDGRPVRAVEGQVIREWM